MTYVDTAILNAVERACRKIQRLTGRTSVWLALQLTNLSVVVYFVWAGMYFWAADITSRVLVGLFCAGVLYALTQTVFKVPIEASEHDALRRVAKGLRNPRRVRDAPLRISFLVFLGVLFFLLLLAQVFPVLIADVHFDMPLVLLTYSLVLLTTSVLYLLACDPLPPEAERVRERLGTAVPAPRAPSGSTLSSRSSRGTFPGGTSRTIVER